MEIEVTGGNPTLSTSGLATEAKQDAEALLIGAVDETASSTDTASSGLNGRLQRIAQRLTSILAKLPALGTAGSASADVISVQGVASMTAVKVDGSAVTQPVSGTFWQATQPVSIATAPVLVAGSAVIGKVGIDQTTPGTTNLVALAANQSVNVAQVNGVTPLMGAGNTGTGSPRVTIASDQVAIPVSQSGTWTVQPGNTANTTAWLVTEVPPSGSTNANSSLASTALEASHVIKASAGRLFQLTGINTKSSAQYIQVFNSASVPADSTAPVLLAYVPAGGNFSWDFGAAGRYFSTGISVSNSSTAATKTIGSADCWFNAEYV